MVSLVCMATFFTGKPCMIKSLSDCGLDIQFLSHLQMAKAEGENWWLGLHTYENDGRFRWSDHSVLNYVSWALGRPHPVSRDRKCVYMSASKGKSSQSKRPRETKSNAVHINELVFSTS